MRTKIAALALATTVALGGGMVVAPDALAQPDADPRTRLEQHLDDLVADGIISEEQAEQIRARIEERIARHEEKRAARQQLSEDIAGSLGLTTEELRDALRSGSSLADLAAEAGVDVNTIIDQLVAAKAGRLQAAVDAGRIDQADADEKLAEIRERITARVNGERPDPDERQRRGPRRFGRFGQFGERPGA